ncbi:SGNH/GDSL hydrolase family protein [uncultured Thiohalocapsa sp.]|uniref:SGNH/GDSL hydrolase family protein n=1 Tax=uncultured Thiohalocapsa sp. TaxID=768990 RepID=UPI0025D1E8A7|nr:SGNH/GDSL hydrolase family protein [uncultured Thiohalocapsa sp.]
MRFPTDTMHKHAWIGSLGLTLAAAAAALLLAEGLLRLAGQSYYWAIAKRPDPVLGWRPPPHAQAWQRFEGEALVRTNGLGFRDEDHARPKASDTLRIAVLGDSFTEAVQVPLAQAWWRVMAARLNGEACALPLRVEALSFAVSGYSTAQSLLAWRAHARTFHPDIVVLAFFIGNDLTENQPVLDAEPMRPYLRPSAQTGGALVQDADFRRRPAYLAATALRGRLLQWLLEHSRIAQLVIQARDAGRLRALAAAPAAAPAARQATGLSAPADPAPQEPGVDNAIYRPPDNSAWDDAWRRTEAMLAAFADETRAVGATPVLMLIGTGVQVHPDPRVPAAFAAALEVPDLGYPVRRLLAVAERQAMTVLNLPASLAARAERDGLLLHGFPGGRPGLGHWNADGHRAAADAAAERLCPLARALASDTDATGSGD